MLIPRNYTLAGSINTNDGEIMVMPGVGSESISKPEISIQNILHINLQYNDDRMMTMYNLMECLFMNNKLNS